MSFKRSVEQIMAERTAFGRRITNWVLSIVAVAPFLSIYLMHYTCDRGQPTGFIGYDQPCYVANGRAIFERGNGFAYPNPFDPDPDSPVIYFHWLLWVLGFGVTKLGIDPGCMYVGVGVASAVLCSRLTLALVDRCSPGSGHRIVLFLFTMWGGGLFTVAALLANLSRGYSYWSDLTRFDPAYGWWFQSWGRNLIYSTEATYHLLMAAAWLGVIDGRWKLSLLAASLLASTHPYSGMQVLTILVAYSAVSWCLPSVRKPPIWFCIAILAVLLCFVGYYLGYLPQFEQHHELVERITRGYELEPAALLLALPLVSALAGIRLWSDFRRIDSTVVILLVCFSISLLLANHGWFVKPRQPIHFTRGYIWLPLCLLGLPALEHSLAWLRNRLRPKPALTIAAVTLAVVAVADNLAFLAQYYHRRADWGFFFSPGEREMLKQMDDQHLNGVLLCEDHALSYLSAAYTGVRPYSGQLDHTPNFSGRRGQTVDWFQRGQTGPWFSAIDLVLVRRDHVPPSLLAAGWRQRLANAEWILFERSRFTNDASGGQIQAEQLP